MADADEDSNHNHRVDHGETNPYDRDTDGDGTDDGTERRTGTDPAHNGLLDFPEPMVFDMVRGLGAEKGEVEVNTLVLVPTSPVAAWWAPEIEAAVVDNFALEFEVGLRNIDLEALKFAFQGTVAMKEGGKTGHGLQARVTSTAKPTAASSSTSPWAGPPTRRWSSVPSKTSSGFPTPTSSAGCPRSIGRSAPASNSKPASASATPLKSRRPSHQSMMRRAR